MLDIEGSERDSTQDWVVPRGTVPLVSELEARIDEALVIARASEEGVREVGEMALDAARQARRAAEAAEASARAAAAVQSRPEPPVVVAEPVAPEEPTAPAPEPAEEPAPVEEPEPTPEPPVHFEVRFRRFSERADRVSARLRALQDHPSHPAAPSVAAARRRGDG
ncbi:MAG TPA: hypothetical protein VGV69_03015 [Solirubrobacterales bacterium]|nr:hypothetical protein [Solirubrobacterales bacterium]